ncbi:MAG TPA: carbamoyl-phosphate synthase small subunit [bacterium]|nr:carbamoyl-phosphate synthase small subunit [bacterium]
MEKAILMLEDGTFFEGLSAGAKTEAFGEIVFNTSMTGYQEILTDPSYKGQIVTMTCPQIGNYGVNPDDAESSAVRAEGLVVKEMSSITSSWRGVMSLRDYLVKNRIPAIEGIDTRALTRRIRDKGAQKSILSAIDLDRKSLLKKVRQSPSINGIDLAAGVSAKAAYKWNAGLKPLNILKNEGIYLYPAANTKRLKVAAIDCGIKRNILRILVSLNCSVTVYPITVKAEELLKSGCDGVFISNGPGDPSAVPYLVAEIKKLLGKKPVFGICFGHQLLAQALGGKTYKLKFGHRGANHPVIDHRTKKIDITVQNHGYAVDVRSLKKSKHKVLITHTNLNDGTNEGIEVKRLRAFSIQHHPEAAAGPHDAKYIFNRFVEEMKE